MECSLFSVLWNNIRFQEMLEVELFLLWTIRTDLLTFFILVQLLQTYHVNQLSPWTNSSAAQKHLVLASQSKNNKNIQIQ